MIFFTRKKMQPEVVELFAPQEYWMLTDPQREDLGNGCGTKGLGGIMVPETLYGLRVTAACDIHDYMYITGQDLKAKKYADRVFLNNMLRIIDARTTWGWLKRLRAVRAHTYYNAVAIFGGPAFWGAKNAKEDMGYR